MKYRPWMTDAEAAVYRRLLKAKKAREKFFKGVFDFFTWLSFLLATGFVLYVFLFVKLRSLEVVFFLDALFININMVVFIDRYINSANAEIIPVEMYSYSLYNLASPFEPFVKALIRALK
jgi:hypothetical protein